jgi:probable rRNA maturation factor
VGLRQIGMPKQTPEIAVSGAEDVAIGIVAVKRVVSLVLLGEGAAGARVSVAFHSSQRMRALNRRTFGKDCATDVIAFPMQHDGSLMGDLYVCPAWARRAARERSLPLKEELFRLLVHGTLHLLGYDHPEGPGRMRSPMWLRQEKYVEQLLGNAG